MCSAQSALTGSSVISIRGPGDCDAAALSEVSTGMNSVVVACGSLSEEPLRHAYIGVEFGRWQKIV